MSVETGAKAATSDSDASICSGRCLSPAVASDISAAASATQPEGPGVKAAGSLPAARVDADSPFISRLPQMRAEGRALAHRSYSPQIATPLRPVETPCSTARAELCRPTVDNCRPTVGLGADVTQSDGRGTPGAARSSHLRLSHAHVLLPDGNGLVAASSTRTNGSGRLSTPAMLLAASRCRHGSAASVDSVASPSTRRQDERVTGGGVVPRCRAALERCIWHLKRGLAGFGISANHAYLRAERKVHEWREEYPLSTRWLLDVPFGLFSLAFFYFDLISDLLVVAALARSGLGAWAGASATILVVQYLVTHLSVLAYLRRSHGVRADVLCAAGVLAFPIGVLLLDLAMFLEPLTLLRELSSLGCANADRLQLFLPSYRATRVILEACLESLPQAALQLHIYIQVARGRASFDLGSAALIALSLVMSVSNLIKTLLLLWLRAKWARVPLGAHLCQQAQLGGGLPLHAIRSNAVESYACTVALDAVSAHELAAALRINRSVRFLELQRTRLGPWAGELLAGVLRANRAITSLDVSHNAIGASGAEHLSSVLRQSSCALRTLNLASNGLGPEGALAIAEALAVNRSLYRLDLSRNQLCGLDAFGLGACNLTGVRALCVALDANSKLHALAIFAHNRLPLEAASALHEVAASKEHLDLDWGADRTSRRSQASVSVSAVSVAIADAEASQPSPSAVRTPAARASGTAWAAARRCTVAPVLRPLAVADAADNAVCVGDASARDECAPEDSCASLLVHEQWHRWQLSPPVSPDVTPTRKSGALRTPSRFSPARFSGIRVSSVDIGERPLNAASMIDEASLCSCTGLTSAEDCRDMGV